MEKIIASLKNDEMKESLQISEINPKCFFIELKESENPIERSQKRLKRMKGQRCIVLDFENPEGLEIQLWVSHHPNKVLSKIIESEDEYLELQKGFIDFLEKGILGGKKMWQRKY